MTIGVVEVVWLLGGSIRLTYGSGYDMVIREVNISCLVLSLKAIENLGVGWSLFPFCRLGSLQGICCFLRSLYMTCCIYNFIDTKLYEKRFSEVSS